MRMQLANEGKDKYVAPHLSEFTAAFLRAQRWFDYGSTWESSSADVRWCKGTELAIVTHLVTQPGRYLNAYRS
jgi:hypothetical protein